MLSTPRGMRDYSPEEAKFLNNLIEKAETVFRRFGFYPLITPALETKEVLNAKVYGGDSEKELFEISEENMGLRYDFTVPMARYVAMNKDLPLPFKRYQIGTAWRKEEPQHMRLREFVQADVDIVGSEDITSDAESIAACATALDEMGVEAYEVHINSRIILDGALEMFGVGKEKWIDAIRVVDKFSKLGYDSTLQELDKIIGKASEGLLNLLTGDTEEAKEKLMANSQRAKEEIEKLENLEDLLKSYGFKGAIIEDFSLARGFAYYTGFVWEFVAREENKKLPSIGGGGRYDNLIGMLSKKPLPATGSSIGISRVFDLLYEETGSRTYAYVFVANVSKEDVKYCIEVATRLRAAGINVDMNNTSRSLAKQLEYANSIKVPYAVIIGEEERKAGKVKLRDMQTGSEELLELDELIEKLA